MTPERRQPSAPDVMNLWEQVCRTIDPRCRIEYSTEDNEWTVFEESGNPIGSGFSKSGRSKIIRIPESQRIGKGIGQSESGAGATMDNEDGAGPSGLKTLSAEEFLANFERSNIKMSLFTSFSLISPALLRQFTWQFTFYSYFESQINSKPKNVCSTLHHPDHSDRGQYGSGDSTSLGF